MWIEVNTFKVALDNKNSLCFQNWLYNGSIDSSRFSLNSKQKIIECIFKGREYESSIYVYSFKFLI